MQPAYNDETCYAYCATGYAALQSEDPALVDTEASFPNLIKTTVPALAPTHTLAAPLTTEYLSAAQQTTPLQPPNFLLPTLGCQTGLIFMSRVVLLMHRPKCCQSAAQQRLRASFTPQHHCRPRTKGRTTTTLIARHQCSTPLLSPLTALQHSETFAQQPRMSPAMSPS